MIHIVRRGETLWHISRQYNTTVDAIVKANNLSNPNLIRVGQRLVVPAAGQQPQQPQPAPVPKPVPGTPFTHRTYTNLYNGRPARIFVTRFPIAAVQHAVLYSGSNPPFSLRGVSAMAKAWGADLAVNCSFFYGGYPLGRHIHNGRRIHDYPPDYPTVIADRWQIDTTYNGIQGLLDRGVKKAFSGMPYLLNQGKQTIGPYPPSLGGTHPRTALGLSRDEKTMIVVVVDGRQSGYSLGVTLPELQRILTDEGAYAWALNLDGGGSSAKWFRGKIVNRPSYGERPVVNVLAFKAW